MLNQKPDDKLSTELTKSHWTALIDNIKGKVGIPILLYFLGAPGFVVLLLWVFFFRGK